MGFGGGTSLSGRGKGIDPLVSKRRTRRESGCRRQLQYDHRPFPPRSQNRARGEVQHGILHGLLLLERKAGLGQFLDKIMRRADVQGMMRKIKFYVDPEAESVGFDKMKTLNIAVIPGDGIGKEVVPEGIRVLQAAGKRFGFGFNWRTFDWSCETYARTGKMMPDDGLEQLRPFDAIFLGAVGYPNVPDHVSLWGLLIPIRRTFRQYV